MLKADGKPLAHTEIEMVPVDSDKIVIDPRMNATTSTSGLFTFRLPPGKYTLSINFNDQPTPLSPFETFFYPKADSRENAEVFVIEENSKPQTITFQLPPALVKRRITGRVVDQNEKAVPNAHIGLRDLGFDVGMGFGVAKTDKFGTFALDALSDRKYQVGVIVYEYEPQMDLRFPRVTGVAESGIFTLDTETKPFKLILKQMSNYDRFRDKYVGFLERNYFQPFISAGKLQNTDL
ncbi:MAG TPA: carboxypeptidase-like regulatory domain-containing protein [Pyrinomonadaceae bacterium]|nr:carboxypeptidase-like regulatory domain-containing protein [Pyrinomonadaceae bacterium]